MTESNKIKQKIKRAIGLIAGIAMILSVVLGGLT